MADLVRTRLARAVEEQERRMYEAEDLVRRQKRIVEKFTMEGLETSAELNLLYDLENELATHKVRLGRLVYEAALAGPPKTSDYLTP